MRIGDLAAATGVSTRALRYYEEQGLLVPDRSTGGHGSYTSAAVHRVRWIQRLCAAGLNSAAILALPPCVAAGVDVDATVGRLAEARASIQARMRGLALAREAVDELIAEARRRRPA